MFYFLIYCSDHKNEISYFLRRCWLYTKNLFRSQTDDGFMKENWNMSLLWLFNPLNAELNPICHSPH